MTSLFVTSFAQDDLIQINAFSWLNATNAISSIWIGRSPELHFSLYTLCFTIHRNEVRDVTLLTSSAVMSFV